MGTIFWILVGVTALVAVATAVLSVQQGQIKMAVSVVVSFLLIALVLWYFSTTGQLL